MEGVQGGRHGGHDAADAAQGEQKCDVVVSVSQYLCQVAAEVAAPLSQTKKITMVSNGDGEIGACRLTGEVLDIMVKVPDMVNKMTGVDITNVRQIPSKYF